MYNELYIIANEFKPNIDYYINDNGTYKKVELNENNFSSGEYYTKIVLNVSQMSSPFIPVRCTENKLKNFDGHDGYVYFTTDTKKIFMGANGDILEMCGNRGFFYAKKDIKYEDNGIAPEENVTFFQAEIEGNSLPETDDLILNKDGCFYRVLSVSEEFGEIYTKRLTLQGSGSVGPGTDSGAPNYTLVVLSQKYTYGTSAEKFPVSIKCSYFGEKENYIEKVTFGLGQDNFDNPFYVDEKNLYFENNIIENTFDLQPYRNLFKTGSNIITIATYDMYGTRRSVSFTLELVELFISDKLDLILSSLEPNFSYSCTLEGDTKDSDVKKEIVCSFYPDGEISETAIYTEVLSIKNSTSKDQTVNLKLNNLNSYGTYLLKVQSFIILSNSTRIASNEIVHKFIYSNQDQGPLFAASFVNTVEQYVETPLSYFLVYPGDTKKNYTLELFEGETLVRELSIESNQRNNYNFYFERSGKRVIVCIIKELSLRYELEVDVQEYQGKIPVIDGYSSNLMLYLSPRGKSNNEINRDTWKDYNNKYTALLEGMHYGLSDGWLVDEKEGPSLKLISGAKMHVPNFYPFQFDPTKLDNINANRGQGITIELDFKISGITDYGAQFIKCMSVNQDGQTRVGFDVVGTKARFYSANSNGTSSSALISANLVENKRIRLTFVIEGGNAGSYPMAYVYLDGILSGATIYANNDKFIQDPNFPAILSMDSTNAQIEIYSVRFYNKALAHSEILNNFTASLYSPDEKEKTFNVNNVFTNGQIDYIKVQDPEYDLGIPYMTITGGWKTEEESKWQLLKQQMANQENNPGLPTGKKDYRLIDLEVRYPKSWLNGEFGGTQQKYKNYSFKNVFSSGKTMDKAYGEKPSNGGAIMYAQGTSSLEYPVKNLRLRFKNEDDWYTVRPDIPPVEIICMKADYMESSGSHNTGAANFIDDLYAVSRIETPGQKNFKEEGTVVTCIKGHPCLIFYRPSEEDNYIYIGKYNLNLDKATPEPFGFKHDENFGWLKPGDSYYSIQYDDEGKKFIGQADPTAGGDYVQGQTEEEKQVQDGEKINSIHCFEFLDNFVQICNFLPRPKNFIKDEETGEMKPDPEGGYYTFEESWYGSFDGKPGWTSGFESRYPKDRVGFHDADCLYPLASWINELYNLPDRAAAVQRFRNEYQKYLDKDFLVSYYVVTEALLMADSRVKNMMIATWGPEKRVYYTDDGQEVETNGYIWYPIFYDMDTMLGLDNTGVYRFNYYDEDTDPTIYNGEEILWNFVRDALQPEIKDYYNKVDNTLTSQTLLNYFNNNQAEMASEAFYNGDADYKYINPAKNNDKGVYLYAAQGNRSLLREWFLTNRIKFLKGKYSTDSYQGNTETLRDRVAFRTYAPSETGDELLNASIAAVRPNQIYTLTSLQTGYAGIKIGQNGTPENTRFDGEETKELSPIGNANGTEAFLLGLSNLSDLGDLSTKYMQKFIFESSDIRLKRLILGNSHKDYYNPYWGTTVDSQSPEISLKGATFLQEFNFYNCSTYNKQLDFSECPVIEKILLTGSGVSSITLPANGLLKELRLPVSVSQLEINTHPYLTDFSIGTYDYNRAGTDRIEDKQYFVNDYSNLNLINIINTPIDTYRIVLEANNLTEYNLPDINWTIDSNISKYCVVPALNFDASKQYYTYNKENKSYEIYEGNSYPTGALLYEKYDLINENQELVSIPVLDWLYTKTPINGNHATALTGTITVKINDPNIKVNEYEIYAKYNSKYPNINIKYEGLSIEKAYTINFYNTQNKELKEGDVAYRSIKHNGTKSWEQLLIDNDIKDPTMLKSDEFIYTFSKRWRIGTTNYYLNFNDPDILKTIPDRDYNLVAVFDKEDRIYTINFLINRTEHASFSPLQTTYSKTESIHQRFNAEKPLYYVYKEYTGNKPHHRNAFKGWISSDNYLNNVKNPELINLENTKIISDNVTYYAYFEEEDCTTTPTDLRCFNINNGVISIAEPYREILEGSITLPSKDSKNNYITSVGDFRVSSSLNTNQILAIRSKIKSIYFLSDNQYSKINDYAFYCSRFGISDLTNIYLPKTDYFTTIGNYAFTDCRNLTNIDFDGNNKLSDNITSIGSFAFAADYTRGSGSMALQLNELPQKLTTLGNSAFYSAGEGIKITQLPEGLTVLEQWSLAFCRNVAIQYFGTDTEGKGLQEIQNAVLYGSGLNKAVTTILLKKSVNKVYVETDSGGYTSAFGGYAIINNWPTYKFEGYFGDLRDQNNNKITNIGTTGIISIGTEEVLVD